MSWGRATLVAIAAALLVPVAGWSSTGGTSPAASKSAAPINIRAAYVPALHTMPVLVAQSKGFFKNNGLKVTLTASPNLATFAPGLGNQYDIVFGSTVDSLVAATRFKTVIISGLAMETKKAPLLDTILRKDSGLTSLSQLKGKTIAVPTLAGTLYTSMRNNLLKAGVNPKDVTFREVPAPLMLDQLNAGQIDATAVPEPFASQQRAAGHRSLGDPALSVASPARSTMWITTRSWASKNAEAIKRWRTTISQAINWIARNRRASRELTEQALKLPAGSTARIPFAVYDTKVTTAQLKPWVTAMDRTDILPKSQAPDVNKIILK